MPFTAQALDSEKIGHNLDREPNMSIAQYDRDRDDRYRDNQYRYRYRDNQYRDRPFVVYYRSRDDRKWIYESIHYNRRDARRAALTFHGKSSSPQKAWLFPQANSQ
jgi:hypothetical protein